ncbi:MAG TPA: YhdP family protein [Burkholderiaceae bacterium]|nr:YhdP family protein [Burkholderiaceae bacterium]
MNLQLKTTQLNLTERAEVPQASRRRHVLRLAWISLAWTLVALFFIAGALLLGVRYVAMPRVDEMRPRIEQTASRLFKAPVTIGRIDASWRGFNPHLALSDVRVAGAGDRPNLSLPRVEGTISWFTALTFEPRFSELRIESLDLDVVRLPGDRISVGGFVFDPNEKGEDGGASDWILAQGEVVLRDARIRYIDRRFTNTSVTPTDFELTHVNLQLENVFGSHIMGLQAQPTSAIAGPIDVRARFRHAPFARPSDYKRWSGEVFVAVDYADLAALARTFEVPVSIKHAQGAVRSWVTFDHARLARVVADIALTNVSITLAQNLEPLTLDSLQGRVTQRVWGTDDGTGGQELEASRLALVTASKQTIAPLDFKVRTTRAKGAEPARTQVQANRVDIQTLAWLATHTPILRESHEVRETVSKHAIAGTLLNVTASWPGPVPELKTLTLKTRFERLVSAAQPAGSHQNQVGKHAIGLPGFENLSGSIDIADGAGVLQLASTDATLTLPGVLAEPRIKLAKLNASARWKSAPALEVRIESAAASSAEIELEASGIYRAASDKGPGWLDLTSRVARLHASAVHRYVPLVAGGATLEWLQHALVSGGVSDGIVRIKGDLARFPFEGERDSEFRIAARVTEASLDVHPAKIQGEQSAEAARRWPLLKDIDADFVLDRGSMTVTAQRVTVYGAKLSNVIARIPNFMRNTTLDVHGVAEGPLVDMVRYVNTSPVVRWIGGVTTNAEATGNAKLDLRLAIPLQHAADAKVTGTLHFANNDVQLADVPPFSRVTGTLNFSETGVRNTSLNATVLGGQSRIEASTQPDGQPMFTMTGIATVPALRRAVSLSPVQQLLDRSQGQAGYSATLTLKPALEFRIESDLIGIAIDGIAPLRKTAQESLPLRIERTPIGENDEWRVAAGKVLAVRVERRRERGELRITRGVIALNEPANLPESGMLVLATVPRLDIEAWSSFFGGGELTPKPAAATPAATSTSPAIDLLAVRTPELVLMGRTFRNVTLGASRTADGGFDANIVSDGVAGYVGWKPEQITARLSRLSIPAARKSEVVEALNSPRRELPALDIAAEQFELSDLKLGRLDLLAQNVGAASAPTWRVRRFDITNADMKFSATGEWAPAASGKARLAKMSFKLDARDAGATLGRLGFAGAMAAGQGALEGDVEWLGSPLDIDYATLSGKLALSLDDGRFLKVDTGNAARLLSLLSLQSLSRTLLFDGGRQFSEGFAYKSIRADATVAQGLMSTSNFRMAGASASALMSGTINLRNETQQLHLVVLPEIDASTAALALGVANPILGLGAFLAQYVLRNPLSIAFALEYDIAGTWTDPAITRRGRVAAADVEATK